MIGVSISRDNEMEIYLKQRTTPIEHSQRISTQARYLLTRPTPHYAVLGLLMVVHLVTTIPNLYGIRCSLRNTQKRATTHRPEPDQSPQYPNIPPHYPLSYVFKSDRQRQISRREFSTTLPFHACYRPCASHIS